jgi:hypothetical protein
MKKLLSLLCLIALFSCDQQKPINAKGSKQRFSKYEPLFRLFNNIGVDTLEVYSTEDGADVMSGREIDSANAMLFPEDIRYRHFMAMQGLFAIYKFGIDKNRLGLLARTPSEYVPSSVKLFIFDIVKDSLTSYLELGENSGDAGDFIIKNTWLFRDTASRHLQALINITHGYDNSADDPKDTTVSTKEYYTLLDLSKPRIDTLFAENETLPKQYKVLVRNRTRN